MKKKYQWAAGILMLLIISPFVFYKIFPYYPVGGCSWGIIKDYNVSVNNKQEAANFLNDYLVNRMENFKNITENDITARGDEFIYKLAKIDKNGRLSECIPNV